jgi:branched-chain amino acid transport system permease protein
VHLLVQTLALGVLIGGIYALVAAGLSLIFGVMRVVNFAHGEMAMFGGYSAYFAASWMGLPALVSLLAALIVGGAIGYVTNSLLLRAAVRGRMDRPGEYVIIVTFALSLLLQASALAMFGPTYRTLSGFWAADVSLGTWIHVSGDRIVTFVAALILLGILLWMVYFTDLGRAWRALTQSPLGARVVGVDVLRLSSWAFATSAALAGAGGALLAPIYLVYPSSGTIALIKGFIVVVIGGMGSIVGSLIGGLLLGVTETLATNYVSSAYQDAYGFLLMILVLLLRPQGLLGKRQARSV